ncbi:hypothetical protein BDV19DRAFT_203237 [Aspergillus venezuelensis]
MQIPRIMEVTSLSRRYAATRRVVHKLVDLSHSSVNLCWAGDHAELVQSDKSADGGYYGKNLTTSGGNINAKKQQQHNPTTQIRVQYSTSTALKIGRAGFLALVLGTYEATRTQVLAFADTIASRVSLPSAWCSELPRGITTEMEEAEFLRTLACALLAKSLVQQVTPNTGLLVHGASEPLKHSIWCQAVAKGKKERRKRDPALPSIQISSQRSPCPAPA